VRDLPPAANQDALDAVLRARESAHPCAFRLVGYDLASNERGLQPELFRSLVTQAREAGLAITVHTGEETPPSYVWENLRVLQPQRIGHGIQSWADPELVAQLREQDIHLEVCPTSNYLTRAVPSLAEHPIRHLYDAGISISINTDDPHVMGIDLVHEYALLQREFGFSPEEFQAINRRALEHSFLPEAQKARARAWFDR
jgi:adenosine deaminase